MRVLVRRIFLLSGLSLLCAGMFPLRAQDWEAKLSDLASQTASAVAKTHRKRVLIATDSSCVDGRPACIALSSHVYEAVRSAAKKMEFVNQGVALAALRDRGLDAIDLSAAQSLKSTAPQLAPDILVLGHVALNGDQDEFLCSVFEVATGRTVGVFRADIADSAFLRQPGMPTPNNRPPSTQATESLRVPPGGTLPQCDYCPSPAYTDAARKARLEGAVLLSVTITEEGTPTTIEVVRSAVSEELTMQAIATVRHWKFIPAKDRDGHPVAVRLPVEINFRLRD